MFKGFNVEMVLLLRAVLLLSISLYSDCLFFLFTDDILPGLPANSNYELGRGNKIGGWEPKPNPHFEGFQIIQVASGGYHSLALSSKANLNILLVILVAPIFGFSCNLIAGASDGGIRGWEGVFMGPWWAWSVGPFFSPESESAYVD